jgi:hypothetical protein
LNMFKFTGLSGRYVRTIVGGCESDEVVTRLGP